MTAATQPSTQADQVLAKAVLRSAQQLGLSQAELGSVLGLHRTGISRLKHNGSLAPDSKQGELALLLIRLARALYALAGGDELWIRHFMHSPNQITGGVPAAQVQSIQGLIAVLRFVDGIRGKL
ncbi:MbcA/ParS/Xre antitoxin family protein [Haliea sp. E1-2-M8]|uniref:MbcA/ParS/Xre antitoxin family protein n=1 Tax=Haliea sp. E1-2-M8 TaxID=3064706 RepID=UPI002715A82E|nr:MbcA/ParS/Xre antitoxin family protein [Haliea sp. E1-2-M8]MDO8862757.1 MbcA/ParS/Xre antitoxin family protein [Haliea sp. E1-2-M8]